MRPGDGDPCVDTSQERRERERTSEHDQGKREVFNATIANSTMFLYLSQGAVAKVLFPRYFPFAFPLFLFL